VSGYALSVFPQHQQLLAASAISPEVARDRGYVSVDSKAQLKRYSEGFGNKCPVPGLLIPLRRADGSVWGYQYRPDAPRIMDGKPRKYETPWQQRGGIDIPPAIREQIGDTSVPLLVTEGTRKADSAVSAGLACVSLLGVWSWRGANPVGGKVALADWHDIALNGRRVVLAFDSDVARKRAVAKALAELASYLGTKGASVAYLHLPDSDEAKCGLDDYLAAEGADGIWELVRPEPPAAANVSATSATAAATPGQGVADTQPVADTAATPEWDGNLAGLLDDVHAFLGRFVAYPTRHARIAHALWCAHTHAMDDWESTPRIAFLSPEPGSGKTRALEVTELLVPRPVEAINTTPAYLFRKVSGPAGLPTILYDEVDTLFGPKAKDNEEIRGMLNAGHRRGAVAGRCVTRGEIVETEELPAYCALALAGLGGLPDTILTRSIVIRMKRRAPDEVVEPFRRRMHEPEGHAIRDRLTAWAANSSLAGQWPEMPPEITDRDADVWECLLMVADAAGGDWPKLAREAAVALVADAKAASPSLGIRLLADIRLVWDETDAMHTETILDLLNKLDEAPWGDLKGKPLDPRRLSRFLREYEVKPADVRALVAGTEKVRKGYKREGLHDAWLRYLPPDPRPRCTVCGKLLAQALIDAGFTDHGEDPAS
jgi:Protein of unknown function (DUF3631)/Domain of unknown function (DUF3854)